MVSEILDRLKQHINTNNPGVFQKSFSGALQLESGKVVITDFRSEMHKVGLSDDRGNFFYIRTEDEIRYLDADDRVSACNNYSVEQDCRALFWVKRGNVSKMIDAFSYDINSFKDDINGASMIKTSLSSADSNFGTIYLEETQKDKPKKPRGVTMVVIDFVLKFQTYGREADCIDRNYCESC